MDNPTISVIMPVYNAKKYIKETVDSILQQTFTDFELILIDDCGTDGSMEIINSYSDGRIKVFHNEKNMGIAYSRNRALKESRGNYIAIMDDDDVAYRSRFEKQVEFLKKNESIDIVGGKTEYINEKNEVIREAIEVVENPQWIQAYFLFYNIFNNSEIMMKRSIVFDNNIFYRDGMLGMEDFDFWVRCSKIATMSNIQDVVLRKRVLETNETSRVKNQFYEDRCRKYAEIQRESLVESGFELADSEYKVLLYMMKEEAMSVCTNVKDVWVFYNVLKKMIMQAREKNMKFVDVLEIWFHMIFIEVVKNMDDKSVWM